MLKHNVAKLSVLAAVVVAIVACAPAAPPAPPAKPAEKPAPAAEPAKPAAEKPAPPAEPAKPVAKAPEKAAFDAKAVEEFYRGKTVRIIVGFAAGGGFDAYSRILARHLPKYLPGSPTVIVENREGAGSMLAANTVFRTAEKDGTAIGNFNEQLVMQQALGKEGIEYDARRFQWLGSLVNSPVACAVRADVGINSFEEVIAGKQIILAADAPGSATYDVPRVIQGALGANIKLVPGYPGTAKSRLAVENKEVDGVCYSWDSMQSTGRAWFEASPQTVKVLVSMGSKTPDHPWLKGVPTAESFAKTPEAKQLLAAINAPSEMSKPYAVGPEVPRDRVEALRNAFNKVVADPDFSAEVEKAQFQAIPLTAQEVETRVKQLFDTPPEVLSKLKEWTK